jgi:arylsulfatase A-like enzyme
MLGVTLPCIFLARLEPYLYYLRPIELLPTYATAWLLLAALSVPFVLIAVAALELASAATLKWPRAALGSLMFWAAAAAALIGLLLDGLIWIQTFGGTAKAGLESSVGTGLGLLALGGAIPIALTARGRSLLSGLAPIAKAGAVLGAVSTLSLFFFRWNADSGAPGSVPVGAAPPGAPHIVLLTIDALSAQHMSLYGATRETTPSLDAFAKQATTFERAYANSNYTTSSVSSILTGTRPWTHRAFQIFSWPSAESRRRSLPEELERAGYTTGYVASNSYAGGSRLGFGPYFDFGASDQVPMDLPCPDRIAAVLPYACPASQLLPLLLAEKVWFRLRASSAAIRSNRHYDPDQAVGTALTWLRTVDRHRPVFVWVHLFPPHAPYAAPLPWLGRFDPSPEGRDLEDTDPADNFAFRALSPERVGLLEARYDEAVQYVDHYAGAFLTQALAVLGDNTAVVVMADHGESFANGYGGHGGPGLYDSIIHVPLIIRLPHQMNPMRPAGPVEQIDIAPTLAALAGVAPPASWEGHSLLPVWKDGPAGETAPANPVFSMNFEENRRGAALTTGALAVVQGSWKLIRYLGPLHYAQKPDLHDELYDLSSDPGETTNRAGDAATAGAAAGSAANADVAAVRARLGQLADAALALHGAAEPGQVALNSRRQPHT